MLKNRRSSGNVLFLILIAVVLFGVLTAAVTNSNRGSTNMSKEQGSINASDIMSYGGAMEKTVARMLGDDMSENGLSFENAAWTSMDGTQLETAALFTKCTTASCKVFDPAGGGMSAKTFSPIAVGTPVAADVQSGHSAIYSMGVEGVGTAAKDLVMMTAVIDQNTCIQINKSLNITNPAGLPPVDSWAGAVLYNGSFGGAADATGTIGDAATQLSGKTSGCVTRSGGAYGKDDNYFYQVLLPR